MQLGIFSKTFTGSGPAEILAKARAAGYECAQFNLTCAGLPSMPDTPVSAADIATIREASASSGVALVALSGTYNMIHPDPAVRAEGLKRLANVIEAARALSIPLVTLCTGSRDAKDMWHHHPDNATPEAWADMIAELGKAAQFAEAAGIDLGVEPEQANPVISADHALRMIEDVGSPRIRIILDPANLFEQASPDAARRIVADAVDKLAGRIAMAHGKDRAADGSFATVGKGVVDFPDFVARLRAAGFDGPLVTHGLTAEEAPGVAAFLAECLRS